MFILNIFYIKRKKINWGVQRTENRVQRTEYREQMKDESHRLR